MAQVSQVSIRVEMMKAKEVTDLGNYMPPVLVCHPWIKEGLAEFCKLQHEANSRQKKNLKSPICSDLL
jgi:hypothetical protein